jgi:predicted amidophosphoribosyltransferase
MTINIYEQITNKTNTIILVPAHPERAAVEGFSPAATRSESTE